MASKTVKLTRSYTVHGKSFDCVVLREPKMKDLLALGEPWEAVSGVDGSRVPIEYLDRIEGYIDRLAIEPTADHLTELGLADALAVKAALGDFFIEARRPSTSSTASSSPGDTTPAGSAN
ncbi:MAG: hypothetical protein LCH86_07700 [Proteobacteria bacterium]|nr:hypothetical protein [Pseudomonadota bacterium]